jgi:RNA polymerase sigma factor (sigma-70 family)
MLVQVKIMDQEKIKKQFTHTIEQHKGIILKVARVYCPSTEDRDDLVQEILIQLWKSYPRYDSTYKISTWMYRIALNVAISYYRSNQARNTLTTPLQEHDLNLSAEPNDRSKEDQLTQLETFIDELKAFDKALILLYLDHKSHQEIAEIMGISNSNVGTKIGRIKEQLRNKFNTLLNLES